MKKLIITAITGIWMSTSLAQRTMVIPMPYHTINLSSKSIFQPKHIYYTDPSLKEEAAFLKKKWGNNIKLKAKKKISGEKGIWLTISDSILSDEGYSMHARNGQVVITGKNDRGVFYGIQTLFQQQSGDSIQECIIEDSPRFGWRGLMLDEARHFFGKEKVKQLLDLMAYFKMNKFHWHLTDEQGWRIEIKKYPDLTLIGGKGDWSNPTGQTAAYYTQEDIRELVTYAQERHIEVIPEIDMPGHATAANKAYPEFSGGGTKEHPDFTFNVGKEETYTFLTNILREISGLFPTRYLHIGGDEVAFGIEAWKNNTAIQKLMQREGMTDVKEAERYFMHRITDSIHSLGRQLIGWDELLDLHTDPQQTTIMWWRHDRPNGLKESLSKGYSTILCPRRPLYFDFIQQKDHKWGRVWNGFCPLEDVYSFPDKGFATWKTTDSLKRYILGIQANVWTERIHNTERFDFMIYPRLCALAESGWSMPEKKEYDDFKRRMETAYKLFDSLHIYYFDERNTHRHPEPTGPTQKKEDPSMDFRD